MRPGGFKTESPGDFLGGELGASFDNRAQRIAQQPGILAVRVVNAPKPVAGLRCQDRRRFHGDSSPQAGFAKMYVIHKMRRES